MPFLLESHDTPTGHDFISQCTQTSLLTQCPFKATVPAVTPDKTAHLASESFEKLFPMLARLPDEDDLDTWNDKASRFAEDYFNPQPDVLLPGTLEYAHEHSNVRYTQSRLPVIDPASKELWIALHNFRPLTASYAGNFQCRASTHKRKPSLSNAVSCPMKASSSTSLDLVKRVFNWSELALPEWTEGSFYGVVFRSKRAIGSDGMTADLLAADKLSHEEAVAHGGLLMYWYGVADAATGSNLATCIWRSREEARRASSLPLHRQAAKLAMTAYEDFELSRYKVVKKKGETSVHIEEWDA